MPSTFNVNATDTFNLAQAGSEVRTVVGVASHNINLQAEIIPVGHPYNYINPIPVSATGSLNLADAASEHRITTWAVSATDTMNLSGVATEHNVTTYSVSASDSLNLSGVASEVAVRVWAVSASDSINLAGLGSEIAQVTRPVVATGSLAFSDLASALVAKAWIASQADSFRFADLATTNIAKGLAATGSLAFSDLASSTVAHAVSATTTFNLSGVGSTSRVWNVSATTTFNLSGVGSLSARPIYVAATTTFNLSGVGTKLVGGVVSTATLSFRDLATASVALADGGGVPGGDSNSGLNSMLSGGISGDFPASYAECPNGLLLIADGVNPMLRWDGQSGVADTAGVIAPTVGPTLGGTGVGTITGTRYAFIRYVDNRGNYSNLSPISNGVVMGRDGLIDDITYSAVGVVTIRSDNHGLLVGEQVVIQGVNGLPINMTVTVASVIDANRFTISGVLITSGTWQGGGAWIWGVANVVYSGLPVSTETKVVRRQVIRNLEGTLTTLYVDLDTTDLTSASLSSTQSDEALAAGEPVPWAGPDDLPLANRYAPPPSAKSVIASHMGRIYAAVDVNYSVGCVTPILGSSYLQGVGTNWPASLAGRAVYVIGAGQSYAISSVDTTNQRLNLATTYADQTVPFALYVIRSAPGERKLVYWSDSVSPEAWPEWNAFAVDENNDQITGLMVMSSFLFVLERRHIHKFTCQQDPAVDGFLFPAVMRGCVNNRCWVVADDHAYMLDETGCHSFDGSETEPISQDIQSLFQQDSLVTDLQIDWSADPTLWHAAHDPVRYTIRWFVTMVGYTGNTHALAYNYRTKRWWVEQYPYPITASTTGTVGYRRSLAGAPARRIVVLSEGVLDGVANSGTLRGTATAADSSGATITDSTASFAGNLGGAPISIVSGTGRGSTDVIASNTSTVLTLVAGIPTDTTSVYQIGGIPWSWRSGWFEYETDGLNDHPRDIGIVYQPLVLGTGVADLQLYVDHSPTPKSWGYTQSNDGCSTTLGEPFISMDLSGRSSRSGFSQQRMSSNQDPQGFSDQFVSVHLSGVQPAEAVRIYSVTIKGVNAKQER